MKEQSLHDFSVKKIANCSTHKRPVLGMVLIQQGMNCSGHESLCVVDQGTSCTSPPSSTTILWCGMCTSHATGGSDAMCEHGVGLGPLPDKLRSHQCDASFTVG